MKLSYNYIMYARKCIRNVILFIYFNVYLNISNVNLNVKLFFSKKIKYIKYKYH